MIVITITGNIEMKNNKHVTPIILILSFLIFIIGWSLRAFLIITKNFNEIVGWAIGLIMHIIWWSCFALVLIRRYKGSLNISLRELVI